MLSNLRLSDPYKVMHYLEIIQVQKLKWCMKQNSVKKNLLFDTYLVATSIRLLNQCWSIWVQFPLEAILFFWNSSMSILYKNVSFVCQNLDYSRRVSFVTFWTSLPIAYFIGESSSCHIIASNLRKTGVSFFSFSE